MFERFTDRARRIVVLAQEQARQLNHNYIGTEHLLLGMIYEGEGIASKALEVLGVTLDEARSAVKDHIGRGQQYPSGHMPFSDDSKAMLDKSMHVALRLKHNYIGTEHLLLGLLDLAKEREISAGVVLEQMGVSLMDVHDKTLELLNMGRA